MKRDWQNILEPILKQAGDILLAYYNKPFSEHEKKEGGFVTPADVASETFLLQKLSELMPEAGIVAEESGAKNAQNAYCWVIDPLDGTTNFAQGLPYFCISVALTHNDIPIVAAIYQPILNEFFYAEQEKGAFLNKAPIHVSEKELTKAIIAFGLSYHHDKALELINSAGQTIIKRAYAIRHFGALAVDLAYVACGKLDGLIFTDLQWWDFAAGMLLVKEAGGIATNFNNKELTPTDKTAIIGGKLIHNELHSLLLHE